MRTEQKAEPMDRNGRISVRLDRESRAALRVLIANGTAEPDAVRRALIEAAERRPDPPRPEHASLAESLTPEEYIAASVAAAPPLTKYQRFVLKSALIDGVSTELSEEAWSKLRESEERN